MREEDWWEPLAGVGFVLFICSFGFYAMTHHWHYGVLTVVGGLMLAVGILRG